MADSFSLPVSGALLLPAEENTRKLGEALANEARGGDVIALRGPLGAGKTALARGFIRALSENGEEVISPTFTLVQTYDTPRGTVWHFDLYRLEKPDDVFELGLEEALAEGISLIEWPESLGPSLLKEALIVDLATVSGSEARQAVLSGGECWRDRAQTVVEHAQIT